jgi:hypothetical protein
MKIVYDNERKDTHRVVIIDNDGNETPIPCYWLQLDDGIQYFSFKRWGNLKERLGIIKKWEALLLSDKEAENE